MHDRDRLRFRVSDTTDLDRRHAPGIGMILPVACGADLPVACRVLGSNTDSIRANIVDRAEVSIVARGAIRFNGVRANAGARIASAGVVTLIARRAGLLNASAGSVRANIVSRAGIPIVAACPIRLGSGSAG